MAKRATPTKKKAAKRTPRMRVAKAEVQGTYRASFEVNEKVFESRGDTAIEAVSTLAATLPTSIMFKTKAFLKLGVRGKESSHMIFPIQFRRLQGGRVAQQIWAKRLEAKIV